MRLKNTLKVFRLFFFIAASFVFSYENDICVSLVIKNHESTIWECLKSVKNIASCISVCDMGSTDRTKELIQEFLKITGIPGKIYQRESEDFLYHSKIGAGAAQRTLKTFGFSLSESYVLMLDPDQILLSSDDFEEYLNDDYYLILEKSSILSCCCYRPRLFRSSLAPETIANAKWVRTVKKLRSLTLDEQIPVWFDEDLDLAEEEKQVWVKDKQEHYRLQKLNRNVEFYTQALKVDPENSSYTLYLAQSYKSLKKYDKAIELYKKRIGQGGDAEGVWFSKYMIGQCNEEMKSWIDALYWYLEAYQFDPNRGEALLKIATHYRLQGQSDLAYLFAKHGWRIPKEESGNLFSFPPLQDYQFDEEISISAYYTRFKEEGYAASSDLLLRKDTPHHIREQGYRNLLFYVQNLKALYVPIKIPLPLVRSDSLETYHPMNPSIHRTENGYKLICRSVNYTQVGAKNFFTNDPAGIFRTRNFLIHYNRSFEKLAHQEIVEDLDRAHYRDYIVQGLEDCRIFKIDGDSWFSCSTFDTNPTGAIQISLCKMKESGLEQPVKVEELIPLKGPDPNRHEKNWLPFMKEGELFFVYSSDPFLLCKPDFETGEMKIVIERSQEYDFSRFRGSAAPIEFDRGYLMLIHEVVQLADFSRCYLHRFVFLDSDFFVKKVSKPFTFQHSGIEYCLSMTIDHDGKQLVMPIGIEDNEAFLAFVDLGEVRSLLQPLPSIYSPF